MYKQIIETFPPLKYADANDLKGIHELIADDFLMTESSKITGMFLEDGLSIDMTMELVRAYMKIYVELKKKGWGGWHYNWRADTWTADIAYAYFKKKFPQQF